MRPASALSLRNCALLVLLLTTVAVNAEEEQQVAGASLSGSFGVLLSYGPVDGSVQTPAGGEPGSSSAGRPTLDELGIDRTTFYDVLAGLRWRRLRFYLGYQAIDLSGQAVLSQSLTSHNVTFPAGTLVSSDIGFNLLRMGAGWKFNLARGRLELFPIGELGVLDFSYDVSGGGQAASRAYAKGYLGFGLAGRYRINTRVSAILNAQASVPISNTPQITALTGGFEFDLLRAGRGARPSVFVGGGAQRIEYQDNQELPNDVNVDLGPFLTTGLSVSF
jgi:hypothetical protein